ncbi:MAG TPA: cupin domain-containing protein [Chloroflexota bacterium]|nr:cupin domain-containing protein [Chloroflexota bacterium]
MISEKRAELEAKVQAHVVRFKDVSPDWTNFSKVKMPNNDRAVYQYLGPDGHGKLPPWALPAERFGLSLICMPPGQGAPAHTHETEEVFMVMEGKLSFWWEEGGEEAHIELGPKDMFFSPARTLRRFTNTTTEPVWLLTVLGGQDARPIYPNEQ